MRPSRRPEARDLRSLDRRGLRTIFAPLDPNEKPLRNRVQAFSGIFTPREPSWKDSIGLMFPPLLVVLISVELWLGVPQLVGWLSVLAFIVAFVGWGFLVTRKR